jgi:hypothetical protein
LGVRILIRIQEHENCAKFTNKPGFLPVRKPRREGFFDLLPALLVYFDVQIELYVTLISNPDQDPH